MSETPKVRSSIPSEGSTRHFDPVLRPELRTLYLARAARLRALAQGHELQDYLHLAADVAETQASCIAAAQPDSPQTGGRSVEPEAIARDGRWLGHLDVLLDALAGRAPAPTLPHLEALKSMPTEARIQAARALAEGRFGAVPAAAAPFIWAALSLEVALAARALPVPPTDLGESANCPICGGTPVASLLHTGDRQGLRYLHCSLCECEWHMVRAKCTNCGDAGKVEYLSFEPAPAVVRAESCGHCSTYLKLVSQEQLTDAETVADDLATLVLDDAVTSEGYKRTGLNPFALPQEPDTAS